MLYLPLDHIPCAVFSVQHSWLCIQWVETVKKQQQNIVCLLYIAAYISILPLTYLFTFIDTTNLRSVQLFMY